VAMRLLGQRDLYAELEKAGLQKTDRQTRITEIWRCPNGFHVTVPNIANGKIGDYILDDILRACGILCHSQVTH